LKPDWKRQPIATLARHNLGKMLDRAKNHGEMKPYLRNLNVRWFEFDLSAPAKPARSKGCKSLTTKT
jgi:type I restriction enzyme S subunit